MRQRRTLEAIERILLRKSLNQPPIVVFEEPGEAEPPGKKLLRAALGFAHPDPVRFDLFRAHPRMAVGIGRLAMKDGLDRPDPFLSDVVLGRTARETVVYPGILSLPGNTLIAKARRKMGIHADYLARLAGVAPKRPELAEKIGHDLRIAGRRRRSRALGARPAAV